MVHRPSTHQPALPHPHPPPLPPPPLHNPPEPVAQHQHQATVTPTQQLTTKPSHTTRHLPASHDNVYDANRTPAASSQQHRTEADPSAAVRLRVHPVPWDVRVDPIAGRDREGYGSGRHGNGESGG